MTTYDLAKLLLSKPDQLIMIKVGDKFQYIYDVKDYDATNDSVAITVLE